MLTKEHQNPTRERWLMTTGQKIAVGVSICILAHTNPVTTIGWWVYAFGKGLNSMGSGGPTTPTRTSPKTEYRYDTDIETDEWESRTGPNTKWVGNTGLDENGKIC